MFIAAIVIPFASGTGAAAKGLALDFVAPEDRADALSGIALIERVGEFYSLLMPLSRSFGLKRFNQLKFQRLRYSDTLLPPSAR